MAASASTALLQPIARGLRAPRAAGVAGLLFSVLFVVSLALLHDHPSSGASAAELKAYYEQGNGRYINLIGLYLAPFAGIAFLWFIAVARSHVGRQTDRFFDTVFLGSGILFVAMLFTAAAASGAFSAALRFQDVDSPVSGAVDLTRALAYSLLFTFGLKAAAVFMFVTSTIGFQTRGLPRWLVYVSWTVAALMLVSVSFWAPIVFVFPAWVTAISLVILFVGGAPA